MKKVYLLIFLQIAMCRGFAQKNAPLYIQKPEPFNVVIDTQHYQGYTIRIKNVVPGTRGQQKTSNIGFDILKDNTTLVNGFQNPVAFSLKEIRKKEDFYKIAQWMIREYISTGHWHNTVPPHIAHKLKI